MKKIAILMFVALLVPILLIPGAASGQVLNVFCPTGYNLLSSNMDGTDFVSRLKVQFTNFGPADAYNVKATIASAPANTSVTDGVVTLGNIPAGGSAWSKDYYELRLHLSSPSGIGEEITWTVEYNAGGSHYVVEDIPQVCYGDSGGIPSVVDPEPPAQPELWAVEYRFGSPKPGFSFKWPNFKSWMNVRFENIGDGDAFHVQAEVMSCPANTTADDAFVSLGYIPAGGSAWSVDTFTLKVDMSNPQDPNEGIFWRVRYDDSWGVSHVIENVPQFPPAPSPL